METGKSDFPLDNSSSRKSLGELLVEEKLITVGQLDSAMDIQQKTGRKTE